jgi:DNA-binding MarR family transcriptional regulator
VLPPLNIVMSRAGARAGRQTSDDLESVTDAVLVASRAFVGIAVRSLAAVDPDVTIAQYRALAVLATMGSQNLGTLSEELGIHPSTATRLCDRLVAKELIDRQPATSDRRETVLSLTTTGQRIVERVTSRRRKDIAAIVDRIPSSQRRALISALGTFADAAAEAPEQAWSLGWARA